MTERLTTMERAYQLARSAECATLADLRGRLSREGYGDVPMQIQGRELCRTLRRLMLESRTSRP